MPTDETPRGERWLREHADAEDRCQSVTAGHMDATDERVEVTEAHRKIARQRVNAVWRSVSPEAENKLMAVQLVAEQIARCEATEARARVCEETHPNSIALAEGHIEQFTRERDAARAELAQRTAEAAQLKEDRRLAHTALDAETAETDRLEAEVERFREALGLWPEFIEAMLDFVPLEDRASLRLKAAEIRTALAATAPKEGE